MFDDLQRLLDSARLLALLTHYTRSGTADRETWHERLMELDGASARELVQLHGELLACDWIEQNTGVVPRCYRVTTDGMQACKDIQKRIADRLPDTAAA